MAKIIYCNTTEVLPGDAARAAGGRGGDAGLPDQEPAQGGQPPAAQPRMEGRQTQQGGQKIFATWKIFWNLQVENQVMKELLLNVFM